MCMTVHIDGDERSTVAELVKAIGRDNVVMDNGAPPRDQDFRFCLCGTNLPESARRAGYEFSTDMITGFFVRPDQAYFWRCGICDALVPVLDIDEHWKAKHGNANVLKYSGPVLQAE